MMTEFDIILDMFRDQGWYVRDAEIRWVDFGDGVNEEGYASATRLEESRMHNTPRFINREHSIAIEKGVLTIHRAKGYPIQAATYGDIIFKMYLADPEFFNVLERMFENGSARD